MKILVGCKLVPEDQDINILTDGCLDMSKAAPKISQFDLNAIEAACEMKTMVSDAMVTALSIGGKSLENSKARKDILSRGPDALAIVKDESFESLLPDQTAKLMAKAAEEIGFDLIVCGDGSGDIYAQQTATRLGAELGVSTLTGVSKIVSLEGGQLTVEKSLENDIEVLALSLPAVIAVSGDINTPSIPGMKAILAAGKKPIHNIEGISVEPTEKLVELIDVKAPEKKDRLNIIIEGDDDDKIAEFVAHIRKIIN